MAACLLANAARGSPEGNDFSRVWRHGNTFAPPGRADASGVCSSDSSSEGRGTAAARSRYSCIGLWVMRRVLLVAELKQMHVVVVAHCWRVVAAEGF